LPESRAAYDPATDPERRARVERVVATYEILMHRVASAHAPEFLGVGVTMSQAKVLYLVQAQPILRMSELSARLGVSLSTVSGVVDRLVDQGLLNRHDDPADRRQVVVGITDAGATQLELFRELNVGQFRDMLARIDEADLAVVERALDILATAALRQTVSPPASRATTTGGTPS
jgi:DNA-binding MarR family transcriptional regulator